jgi:FtsZ-binding cell division protein ZapB
MARVSPLPEEVLHEIEKSSDARQTDFFDVSRSEIEQLKERLTALARENQQLSRQLEDIVRRMKPK